MYKSKLRKKKKYINIYKKSTHGWTMKLVIPNVKKKNACMRQKSKVNKSGVERINNTVVNDIIN